jgi:Flp pilus assembly pilin Flp
MRALRSLLIDEEGVALPEYALALALISLGAAMALAGVATACSVAWANTSTAMQTYSVGTPPPGFASTAASAVRRSPRPRSS